MGINKIIKYYFSFLVIVSSFAALSLYPGVKEHMSKSYASVVNVLDDLAWKDQEVLVHSKPLVEVMPVETVKHEKTNGNIFLEFESGDEGNFVLADAEKFGGFLLDLRGEDDFQLKGVKFKLLAEGEEYVESGILRVGEDNYAEAKVEGGYLDFALDAKSSEGKLAMSMELALKEGKNTGSRIGLEIQSPEDIRLSSDLSAIYPISSFFASVVGGH